MATDGIVGDLTWNALFPLEPAHMYDLSVDGKGVKSSRHVNELLPVVEKLISQKVKEIVISKSNR